MDSLPQAHLVLKTPGGGVDELHTSAEQQLCPFPVFRKCNVTVLVQIKVVMDRASAEFEMGFQ